MVLRKTLSRALASACALALLASCEPLADTLDWKDKPVLIWKAKEQHPVADPAPTKLKVMAWNVKYGAGRIDFWFDFWGDRVQMTVPEVEKNMDAIYALINELDPDILMTEEIEQNSKRSAYYDMINGMLEHTKLNYAAYFQTWQSRYIPSEGVGRMDLGNAIFSKYPITKGEMIRQDDRTDIDPATLLFYIHRAIGRAELQVGDKQIAAFVVHTEAYDFDGTKRKHLQQIYDVLKAEKLPFVIGGDFNELPPSSVKKENFRDEHPNPDDPTDTSFKQPPYHPEDMQKFYDDFTPVISLEQYGKTEEEQSHYYSHTILGPDQKDANGVPGFWTRNLDFLFVRKTDSWTPGTTDIVQERGRAKGWTRGEGVQSDVLRLSDHCPVVGTWELH